MFFTPFRTSAVVLPFLQLLESADPKTNYKSCGRILAKATELRLTWSIINVSRTLYEILGFSLLFNPTAMRSPTDGCGVFRIPCSRLRDPAKLPAPITRRSWTGAGSWRPGALQLCQHGAVPGLTCSASQNERGFSFVRTQLHRCCVGG